MSEQSREAIGASVGAFEPWINAKTADVTLRERAQNINRRRYGAPARERASDMRPDVLPEVLAAEVCNALFWDLAVPRDRVRPQCDGDWVTLTGVVERPYQRSAAEADVRRVPGVRGVTNAITVQTSAAP